jgi:hypothetical protein
MPSMSAAFIFASSRARLTANGWKKEKGFGRRDSAREPCEHVPSFSDAMIWLRMDEFRRIAHDYTSVREPLEG